MQRGAGGDDLGVRRADLQVLVIELVAGAGVEVEERRNVFRAREVDEAEEPDQRQD